MIFWPRANASTKRHARNRVQRLSVHTQPSSATQLGDARRERDRRGRLYFEGWTTDHAVAVAALESSGGDGPGAIAFLQQNNSYLRPASRT